MWVELFVGSLPSRVFLLVFLLIAVKNTLLKKHMWLLYTYLGICTFVFNIFQFWIWYPGVLRHWEDNHGRAHSFGGLSYRNGELIIPKVGRYYIYSQLYFQDENDKPHLIHYVHLTSNNITSVIMRSVTSRCPSKKSNMYLFSSYQGGVFPLNIGDRLSVGVSEGHSGAVSMEESASFFGAFMI
jgi:tumor necrosis factor ligand superfamily protein 10